MRKIVFAALILVLFFSGCSLRGTQSAEKPLASDGDLPERATPAIKITHGSREDWAEYGTLADQSRYDLVVTEERALAIANVILEGSIEPTDEIVFTEVNVWEDVERRVWVISYYPQSTDPRFRIVGGAIHIVIRRHDAQVVNIWGEE